MFKSANLLSISSDAKTVKGEELGFLTGILYLAPAKSSGFQVCSMAKLAGCEKPCLYTAGRGAFNSVQTARLNKTRFFFSDRELFMLTLVKNVRSLVKKARKLNLTPLVRLNGTSDIKWENVPVTIDGVTYENIMAVFPDVQFYDYTKLYNRDNLPVNYDLTFSYSGVPTFTKYVDIAVSKGMRIAAVFKSIDIIPHTYMGRPVVSGDNSDIRHLDDKGTIVALYAKGKAKRDTSGFVIQSC